MFAKAKGHMLPLSNYTMVLYANGKWVTLKLQRENTKNWSALMSGSDKGRASVWGILLYKYQVSYSLEIIRK